MAFDCPRDSLVVVIVDGDGENLSYRNDRLCRIAGFNVRHLCLTHQAAGPLLAEADLIVPVPLHRWRLLHRRYNQAALLAMGLSKRSGVPCMPDLLKRTRRTAPQGTMGRDARERNVKGAIQLSKTVDSLEKKRILLVDDVLTTGATLGECVRILRLAGASAVDVVTLARVVLSQ